MPNHESPRHVSYMSSAVSSSVVFDTLHAGRERIAGPAKLSSPSRVKRALGPDAIWGQFNNYRSNFALLGLILCGAIFGHQAVQEVQQHETLCEA